MTSEVKRTVKLITQQSILTDVPPVDEGFPMRRWSIRVVLAGSAGGEDIAANIFEKVTYKLHPTFTNPVRSLKRPPFKIEEEGWGEFDMEITFTLMDRGGEQSVRHDLNFQKQKYESLHVLSVPSTRPALAQMLLESGPVPGLGAGPVAAAGPAAGGADSGLIGDNLPKRDKRKPDLDDKPKKKSKVDSKSVDMDKLAEGLQKLSEDDLLQVVQLVTDHKTNESYVVNNVDGKPRMGGSLG